MCRRIKLEDHFQSLDEVLDKLRHVLTVKAAAAKRMSHPVHSSIELLDKAIAKARESEAYAQKMADALLRGSTVELRDLLSDFGNYFGPPSSTFPFYPHADAVNGIDSVLGAIKFEIIKPGSLQEHFDFHQLMSN